MTEVLIEAAAALLLIFAAFFWVMVGDQSEIAPAAAKAGAMYIAAPLTFVAYLLLVLS